MAKSKKAPAKKMGRPKKEPSILWDGWQSDVLAIYAEGGSNEEIKGFIVSECMERGIDCSMSDDLWRRWMNERPDFSGTIKQGVSLSQQWWLRAGRKNLENKEFSPTLWYMNMKNRFGWADKQETKVEQSGTITIEINKFL